MMPMPPAQLARYIHRAEQIALQTEPDLAALPSVERRRLLMWAWLRRRRETTDDH